MADACDAFPGDLFEETFERLAGDHDHYVCAAARRAGERRSARRRATEKSDAADRLTQALGGTPFAERTKGDNHRG